MGEQPFEYSLSNRRNEKYRMWIIEPVVSDITPDIEKPLFFSLYT